MKKLLSILLVVMLFINSMAMTVFAAGVGTEVIVSNTTAVSGEAAVSISLKGNSGFTAYGFSISYPGDLKLVRVEAGELSDDGVFVANTETGKVTYAGTDLVTDDGVLVTAIFEVVDGASGEFDVTVVMDKIGTKDDTFSASVTSGSVTVPCTHSAYSEVVDAKYLKSAATCISPAVYYKVCANEDCGVVSSETFAYGDVDPTNPVGELEVRGHKDATSKEDGYTGDVYCSDCGTMIDEGQVIPKNDNQFDFEQWFMWIMMMHSQKYTITATAGEGGTITPEGKTQVKYNGSLTYTIKADDGYEIASVMVDGKEIGAVEEYTFTNVRSDKTIDVTFKKNAAIPFTDIKPTDSCYEAVEYLYKKGIMNGISDTKFGPDMTITRGMFVTILGRLHNVNTSLYTDTSFKDVKTGEYYSAYVEWAAENGIVLGYGDDTFGVEDEITIEQAVTIIARYTEFAGYTVENGADLDEYKDGAEVADWAVEAMEWAIAEKIYVPGTAIDPQSPASRAQVAIMIYNCALNVLG